MCNFSYFCLFIYLFFVIIIIFSQIFNRSLDWGSSCQTAAPPALELLRAVFSPHCSSSSAPMTAPLKTPLSNSWSSQMTPHSSASSRTYLPSTHHHEQHCDCSGVIQIPGNHHLSGPEVGHSHRLHCQKGPAEVVLPSPAEEVQPATGAAETVLLCHHRVCSVHFDNCLVWLGYKIRHQKTTENGPDCWEDYWCSPACPPFKNCIHPEWGKGLRKSLWIPHIQAISFLNFCHLAGTTEPQRPGQPGTRTVSSPRQSP